MDREQLGGYLEDPEVYRKLRGRASKKLMAVGWAGADAKAAAPDTVQQAALKALKSRTGPQDAASLPAWFRRVLDNVARDMGREARREDHAYAAIEAVQREHTRQRFGARPTPPAAGSDEPTARREYVRLPSDSPRVWRVTVAPSELFHAPVWTPEDMYFAQELETQPPGVSDLAWDLFWRARIDGVRVRTLAKEHGLSKSSVDRRIQAVERAIEERRGGRGK